MSYWKRSASKSKKPRATVSELDKFREQKEKARKKLLGSNSLLKALDNRERSEWDKERHRLYVAQIADRLK